MTHVNRPGLVVCGGQNMGMLRIVPKGGFSRDLTVFQGDQAVAGVTYAWLTGTGSLLIDEGTYAVRQEGRGLGTFVLEQEGEPIAHARYVRTLFQQGCAIDYAGRHYRLEGRSLLSKSIVLRQGAEFVGYLEPEHALTRKSRACLPDYLPLAVRVFIIALAMHMWSGQ
jgi:hypothetical protein